MDSYLEEIITCKYCGGKEQRGKFIWLNGEELCPDCYKRKRELLDSYYQKGYDKGYDDALENTKDEEYFS